MTLPGCPEGDDELLLLAVEPLGGGPMQNHLAQCDACCARLQRLREELLAIRQTAHTLAHDRLERHFALPKRYPIMGTMRRDDSVRVQRALHPPLGTELVLRTTIFTTPLSEPQCASFLREAEQLARLDHPAVARILDAGFADGMPYLVREYVSGSNLEQCASPSLAGLLDLARAVAMAHGQGVVHGRIHRRNVIVDAAAGRWRITDFLPSIIRQPASAAEDVKALGELLEMKGGGAQEAEEFTDVGHFVAALERRMRQRTWSRAALIGGWVVLLALVAWWLCVR
jgi:tRNA A-37 threonylcarbamoyl transferase component Bud32